MNKSKPLYQGQIIKLALETVQLPDGRCFEQEIVRHPGGAAVVALNSHSEVCLVYQYRHVANGWIWEIPAGKLEPGEAPLTTAERELEEEAGLRANMWTSLGSMLSSPGVFDEVIYLFMAHDLTEVPAHRESHELLEVHWISLDEALMWIQNGQIRDAKSQVGLYQAHAYLRAMRQAPADSD
jgi:ADP-ribose pyrophosphatase